jgi:hypothetical protein
MFFDCLDQQVQAMIPFIKDGIAQGDRSLMLIEGRQFGAWKQALELHGVDVHASIEAGKLSFRANSKWLQPDEFNSIRMARRVWEAVERSLERHSTVRVIADLGWTLEAGVTSDQVCHWEATLDCLLSPDIPAKVICMYDRRRLPLESLHAALRTHPAVIAGESTSANPYYEAPAILEHEPFLNECSGDALTVGRMLGEFIGASDATFAR